MFLASEADPLKAATEALIAWSVASADALKVAIGATDDPLIAATNSFLAVDADALKPVSILSAIAFLAAEADPLKSYID